ncbi:hypothetical protein EDB83DRAFT_2320957 [Lactarius deliciosus]|nr:hypothetical protein EDB83DRAFT_2320957 [Lactarius deliciosus]
MVPRCATISTWIGRGQNVSVGGWEATGAIETLAEAKLETLTLSERKRTWRRKEPPRKPNVRAEVKSEKSEKEASYAEVVFEADSRNGSQSNVFKVERLPEPSGLNDVHDRLSSWTRYRRDLQPSTANLNIQNAGHGVSDPHTSSTAPAARCWRYPGIDEPAAGDMWHVVACHHRTPQTISTPYGLRENIRLGYATTLCNLFAQLGYAWRRRRGGTKYPMTALEDSYP